MNAQIFDVNYGESILSEKLIFLDGNENKFRNIVFKLFLIKIHDKLILVDAGCETMPGFIMKNFIGPVKALEKLNVLPEQITDVIITHAHHDHIECVKYFQNAVIHIQKDEFVKGKKYIPDGFKTNVFFDEFTVVQGVRIVKIGGHSIGSCVVEVETKNQTIVISGDECYSRECLKKKIPTGSSFCREKSKAFIEKYSDEKYMVLLCHDI